MNRRITLLAAAATAALAGVLAWPAPAQAHPISNFSVNQYRGLTLHPDRVDVIAAVDIAEIPTLQEKPRVDTDHDGKLSAAELSAYAGAECRRLADGFAVRVGRVALQWTITQPSYQVTPGAAGLETSRLGCRLAAPATLQDPATVRAENRYQAGRVGWQEITAAGAGVRLVQSSIPAESISDELHSYPKDLLTSTPDVRSATLRTGGAGSGGAAGPAATPVRGSTSGPAWLAAAQQRVESALGGRLTPLVIGLAFLLAILLGAGHAALPGHGKTVMAAYFAGRRGRIRDALAVGGTVTLAHTGGVLLVGLLLSTSTALAGEQLLAWLGAASGVLVAAVGIGMLVSALGARRTGAALHHGQHSHSHGPHSHSHGPHGHTHGTHSHTHGPHGHAEGDHEHPEPGHANGDGEDHDHHGLRPGRRHGHGLRHDHHHDHGPRRPGGRLGLAGIGLAGGLVPSPSALVVLLGAIGLGRAGLGVLLVLAYGIGMAGTLTAVGLLLVVAQRRLGHLVARGGRTARLGGGIARLTGRVSASAPTATAALVVLVGLGMGVRAVG